MKVGLNATCLNDRPSGARQRFIGIYSELFKRLSDTEFVIYEPADCRISRWFEATPNLSYRRTPIPSKGHGRKLVEGFWYWHRSLCAERFDIFEGFALPLVKAPTGQTILTVHDIRGRYLGWRSLHHVPYKAILQKSLRNADHVIAVSEAMRNEIHCFYPYVPITVIHNGLNIGDFDRISDIDLVRVRQKFEIPEEFVLTVGHIEKRKNYLLLVDAIAKLRDQGSPHSLLIVGNDSGWKKAIEERVASKNLSNSVRILENMTDLEVRSVYKLASLFVFPSSYEGFGIPILEAMAASCPTVLSDIPVFREITENKGNYFRHCDVDAMACAIDHVLKSYGERRRLVEYGAGRVKAFSHQSAATQLSRLYRSLVKPY